jgi:hypothetical protein
MQAPDTEIELYHVTNVPSREKRPSWLHLEPSVNRDEYYDGALIALSTISMTSTRMNGALPTWSPYPTGGKIGTKYHRAISKIRRREYSIFKMFEKRGQRNGVIQIQLLLLRKDNVIEGDFAKVLKGFEFPEWKKPLANEFTGKPSMIINCHFLHPMKISSFSKKGSEKRDFGAGKLVDVVGVKESKSLEQMLIAWIDRISSQRKVNFEIPARFSKLKSLDNPATRKLIANLDQLYQRSLVVLKDLNVDFEKISALKLQKLLEQHKMPPICLGCLEVFSSRGLHTHLHTNKAHLCSAKKLKLEKRQILQKITQNSPDAVKVKIIYAVKHAALRPIVGTRRPR